MINGVGRGWDMCNNSRLLDQGYLDILLSASFTCTNSFNPQNTFEILDTFSYYLLFIRQLRPREGKRLALGKWCSESVNTCVEPLGCTPFSGE